MPDLAMAVQTLPKKSGQEVLLYIKNNNVYKHIPVIMLTISSESDIISSYQNK